MELNGCSGAEARPRKGFAPNAFMPNRLEQYTIAVKIQNRF